MTTQPTLTRPAAPRLNFATSRLRRPIINPQLLPKYTRLNIASAWSWSNNVKSTSRLFFSTQHLSAKSSNWAPKALLSGYSVCSVLRYCPRGVLAFPSFAVEIMDIVDLREIEESNETTNQIAIFRIIKDNLTSSASSTDAKVDLISSSLIRLCSSESTPAAKDAFRMEFWFMVVDIARYLPPNHPWQQILVGVVSNLRNYGGQNGDIDLAKWWDLSKFTMYLFDHWSGMYCNAYSDTRARCDVCTDLIFHQKTLRI